MKHPLFQIDTDKCTKCVLEMIEEVKRDVEKYHPEFITPEQVLYGLIYQIEFMSYCDDHGISQHDLAEELFSHLMQQDSVTEIDGDNGESIPSHQFMQLMDRLTEHNAEVSKKVKANIPYNIPDMLWVMNNLEDSMATYLLEKYITSDSNWFNGMMKAYSDDISNFMMRDLEKTIQAEDAAPEEDDSSEITEGGAEITIQRSIMGIPEGASLPGLPAGGHIVAAEAFVNGKRIDLSQGDLYKKLMASAGRLMSSLNAMGAGPAAAAGKGKRRGKKDDPDKEQKEPWEEMVTCLNETYKTKNPLIGRQKELQRAIRILCRKDKNNPVFVGESGVGKTALIYGLARMLEEDAQAAMEGGQAWNLPQSIRFKRIYAVDMAAMVAGASYHGEFERRMKEVLEGAKRMGKCILYIDEIHTIMSADGGNNTLSAADLLKPYLEDGSVRIIGTTTYADYNKSIANNKALSRRFGQIDVKEPSVDDAIEIIHQIAPVYEKHHGVRYDDEAIRYAVEQSDALIHDRFLPDKAIDIIDEAGAYLQQNPLLNKKGEPKPARWQKVDKAIIKNILTDVCRIDAKALAAESNESLENLDGRISSEIYGQDEAIKQVVRAVMMSKAGLMEPDKPLASLLFVGPTGVGKTEVCKVLAKELGVELVRFDMSEYTEKHTISKLIGSPAGYVGYEEGGLLTDAIRKTPNCVLLLDEIEKAHSDIYNILLQVMDYARLTDNKGNKADFRNVILIMTSNAGAQFAGQAGIGFTGGLSKGQAMLNTVKKTFKPEFLNRLSGTVVFNEMDKTMAGLILDKKLRQLSQRLEKRNVTMTLTPEAHDFLLKKGFTNQYGAREMDRAIQQHLTPLLMESILFGKLKKGGKVEVAKKGEKLTL